MAITNNNKNMIDRPMWEQLSFAPVSGAGGTTIADDNKRYIYNYIQTAATTAQFWRYDTWADSWQQLATPATQTGTIADLVHTDDIGGQWSGQVMGSLYLFVGNGTICYFYKYDIATNVWSANLGTTGLLATFGTDCRLNYPSVSKNAYSTSYHSGVTRTITTSALAAAGATTVSVAALPEALAIGTVLRFGTYNITITGATAKGSTSLTVTGATEAMSAGTILYTDNGSEVCLASASLAGATTLTVHPVIRALPAGATLKVDKFAVLTAAAALSATSITVAALRVGIPSASTAGYYGNMYLIGNASTAMFRYNIGANAWYTTSANSANPAIPAITGAVGAGNGLKWTPAYTPDKLWVIRGAATANVYVYDLVTNTWAGETFYPSTETFTTGTCTATKSVNGKPATVLIQKDTTMRIYEGNPYKNTLEPKLNQWLYPTSTAVVGDRTCVLTSPDGIEFYYFLLHSSAAFVRCALIDS